mmetsp:Transcript_8983/g.22253  ORF Transcript_8983/g.22253 Transcript_8983/m.22253 type:complete len:173 (-) Transcript_8983:223-741(-)
MEWPDAKANGPVGQAWREALNEESTFVALASQVARTVVSARQAQERQEQQEQDSQGSEHCQEEDTQGPSLDAMLQSSRREERKNLASLNNWEFRMRPVAELMDQIWWRDTRGNLIRDEAWNRVLEQRPWLREGSLLPRRPLPDHGLSMLWGQESIFMVADRFELWVYACYVD